MKKPYYLIAVLFFALQAIFTQQLNAQCAAPTELSAVNFTPNAGGYGVYLLVNNSTATSASQYNIRYRASFNTTWTVLEHVNLPYQLANLGCNTTYVWQAQQICVSPTGVTSVSDWSALFTFVTSQCTAPPPLPCLPPSGPLYSNVSQTTASLYLNTTTTNALLYNIRYHVSGTPNWTLVEHVGIPYQLGNLTCGTTYEWQAQLLCTDSASGLTSLSDWSVSGTFTTLACTPPPTCNAPTGLSATNVSQTGAYLYLTPTSSNTGTFNIRYHGGTNTTWTTLEHVTLPYQLGNLTCGTTYEWQAQLICTTTAGTTATILSDWSTGGTFTTLACTPPPTCNAPTGLSATNVSQTGAYLYLTPTSSNTGTFNIRYHGGTNTTWTTLEHVTLPYQLGNLTCGTTYEWQAQLICPNTPTGVITTSDWSTGGTFTTLACTPPPTCNAPTGLTATNVSQTGAYLYLTPTSSNTGTFNIRYHGGTTTTWTTLEHVTLPYQLGNLTCGTTYEWQAQLICPNTPAGAIATSDWSTGGTFTTLACTPPPTCNAPTGLSATNVSQTGATLYLSPTSSNTGTFNIRYHGGTTTAWTTVEHVTLPYQLGNLTCGTTYEWQAQLICPNTATGAITTSDWSIGGTFTTLACTPPPTCNAPTGLSATNVSQTGAYLYLTPTSNNTGTFNIRYHGGTNTTWTTVEHVTLPYQLGNLACGTTYEWQAQLICNSSAASPILTVSPWSAGGTFTTLACPNPTSCNAPTGLFTTDVSPTSAILHWNAVPGAIAYIVRYKKANNTTLEFTTVTASTNVITLTGLTPGSYYIWQVQAVCSTTVGGLSAFSANAYFATPSVTIFPNPANGLLNVSFWLNALSRTTVTLRNSNGQIVYSSEVLSQEGTNQFGLDTSEFSAGLYFLNVRTNSYNTTLKLIISH